MELLGRFTRIIYILIIASNIDYSMLRSLHIDKNNESNEALYQHNQRSHEDLSSSDVEHTQRQQRQVVQPEWLTDLDNMKVLVDHRVHITDESLKEAAAIRESIQDAVDEGRYAIDDTNSNNPKQPPVKPAPPAPPAKPAVPPTPAVPSLASSPSPDLPSFFMPPPAMQWQWNLHSPSNFSHFQSLFPGDETDFVLEMQRMWQQFVENTRNMFRWN